MELNKKMSHSIKRLRIRDIIKENGGKRSKWKEKWLKGKDFHSIVHWILPLNCRTEDTVKDLEIKMRQTKKLLLVLCKKKTKYIQLLSFCELDIIDWTWTNYRLIYSCGDVPENECFLVNHTVSAFKWHGYNEHYRTITIFFRYHIILQNSVFLSSELFFKFKLVLAFPLLRKLYHLMLSSILYVSLNSDSHHHVKSRFLFPYHFM